MTIGAFGDASFSDVLESAGPGGPYGPLLTPRVFEYPGGSGGPSGPGGPSSPRDASGLGDTRPAK